MEWLKNKMMVDDLIDTAIDNDLGAAWVVNAAIEHLDMNDKIREYIFTSLNKFYTSHPDEPDLP